MTKITQLNVGEDGGRRRIHLREISGDSETPLETVGQDLRAARLRRGDDLATVSRALKIRKDHLDAVEADDLTRLPGKTYAIGFVRSYAGYLGLDASQTVERFKQEISGRQDDHATSASAMPDEDRRRLPQGWRIVAGVVVLALAYGVWHLLSAGPVAQPVPPAPVITPPRVAARPAAPPPTAQTEAVPSPALQKLPPDAISPPAKASLTPNSVAAAATSGSATPVAAAPAVPVAPDKPGHVYGAQNKSARLVLRARADTHIEVRGADGRLFINRMLNAGDQYRVPNVEGLTLSSSNAGGVEMSLDGVSMGRAGFDQQPASDIDLNSQALADRYKNH